MRQLIEDIERPHALVLVAVVLATPHFLWEYLRKNRVPEDLIRFWIGHADKSVTDGYSKVKEDVSFRSVCAENVGLGFELPAQIQNEKPEVAPNCTQSEVVSSVEG